MHLTRFPLPIVHHYRMPADRGEQLVDILTGMDLRSLRAIPGLSAGRIAFLPVAAGLLATLSRHLGASELIVSAYGLREGLLHAGLAPTVRDADPLILATRDTGARLGRFPEHGDLLDRWVAPLFADENAADARLRQATCQLSDIAWRVHPEFRAERGLDAALHGNWVGVDARGRAMMARALYTNFGGRGATPVVRTLCTVEEAARADRWGLAMRLGQRFAGGMAHALESSRLALGPKTLTLHVAAEDAVLYGEAVERRHKALASAFKRKPALVVD
jgi:exopolyphosphatase/guanosine-5'-triphosphate,3'-diphosphate pyrophosphatase